MRRLIVIGGGVLLGMVLLVGGAYGGDSDSDSNGGSTGSSGAAPSSSGASASSADRPTAPATPEPTEASATIEAVAGSGVTGTATATKVGAGSEVVISVTGLSAGKHSTYLKADACDGAGQRFGPLTELEASADGDAEATTPLPAARLGELLDKKYHVVIYAGDNSAQGDIVGCGELVAG